MQHLLDCCPVVWFISYFMLIDNDNQSVLCSPQSAGGGGRLSVICDRCTLYRVRARVREYRTHKQQHAVTVQLIVRRASTLPLGQWMTWPIIFPVRGPNHARTHFAVRLEMRFNIIENNNNNNYYYYRALLNYICNILERLTPHKMTNRFNTFVRTRYKLTRFRDDIKAILTHLIYCSKIIVVNNVTT